MQRALRTLASKSSLRLDILKAFTNTEPLTSLSKCLAVVNPTHSRALHTSAALLAAQQVKIPALGESITDGTVSAVLKQAGESVEEDEPIVQIETDKVTVDVRSPCAGVITSILVKTNDTVEVGHVVASIEQGAAAGQAEGTAPPIQPHTSFSASEQQQQPSPAAAAAFTTTTTQAITQSSSSSHNNSTNTQSTHSSTKYTPSIAFPPRRTPNGDIISMLTAAEAQAAIKSQTQTVSQGIVGDGDVSGYSYGAGGKNGYTPPPLPPRREMSDAEMEAIMLGGAM